MKLYRVFTLLAIALLSADLHSRSYITHETVIEDTASTTSSGRLVIHLNPDPHDPILASTVQITTADGLMVTEQQFSEKPQIKNGQELYTHPFSVSYKLTAPKIDLISESVVTLRFTTATDKKNRVHELALNDNYKFTAPSPRTAKVIAMPQVYAADNATFLPNDAPPCDCKMPAVIGIIG